MSLPIINSLEWSDQDCVLVRVDFNVPLDDDGNITDDSRIQGALPTIRYLLERSAKVVLCSHLGRPKGRFIAQLSLLPVAHRLKELLNTEVLFITETIGSGPQKAISEMQPGQVLLLENLRFHAGEKKNNPDFGAKLASLCNAYVNDAFGVLHRKHASVHAAAKKFEKRAVGFLIEKEYNALSKLFDESSKPMVAVLGGAKVADKIILLENMTHHCSDILIGGAMAYTFLQAQGIQTGRSRIEKDKIKLAQTLLEKCELRGVKLHLPVDHISAESFSEQSAPIAEVELGEKHMGLDIGAQTREQYDAVLTQAKSVFWNGPMGVFEWEHFSHGTKAVAESMAKSTGYTVIGGGDSVAAINQFDLAKQVDHISTGGGASLAFMEGDVLPGLAIFSEPA